MDEIWKRSQGGTKDRVKSRFRKIKCILFINLLGVVMVIGSSCVETQSVKTLPRVLPVAWEGYRHHFIHANGRVFRPYNHHDTVSEGQAYALLMAVAFNDQITFDRVWGWTERNLSRLGRFGDHLLAWHWEVGQGVTDWNSAADAEVDTAFALLLASQRWDDLRYHQRALRLLEDILKFETKVIGQDRYLLPGNWGMEKEPCVINPSYFSPSHFRLFFHVTGDTRWREVLASSYSLLRRLPLEETLSVQPGLVPDWIGIDHTEKLLPLQGYSGHSTWDAVRMPWRVALDVLWVNDPRGQEYVEKVVRFLTQEWQERNGRFFLEYQLTGEPLRTEEQVGSYAMALPAFLSMDSPYTPALLEKVLAKYEEQQQHFSPAGDYYQNSLSLLGLLSLVPTTQSDFPSLIPLLRNVSPDNAVGSASNMYDSSPVL